MLLEKENAKATSYRRTTTKSRWAETQTTTHTHTHLYIHTYIHKYIHTYTHIQTATTHRTSWCDSLNVASCVFEMHYLLDRESASVTGRVTNGRGVVVSCGSKIYESKSLTFPRTTLPLHCWNWHLPSLSLSQATFINAIKEIDARWYPLSYSSLSPLLSIDRKLPVSDNILWVVDRVAPIHIIFTGIFALSQGWVLDIVLWTVCCAAYAIEFTSEACMYACMRKLEQAADYT